MDQLPLVGIPPAPPPPTPMRKGKPKRYAITPATTTRASTRAKPKAPTPPHFDGATYDHARDGVRLAAQMLRVLGAMGDGQWHTLGEIANTTMDPTPSISARLRDLRKARFGGFVIEREHVSNGLHRYRLAPRPAMGAGSTRGECV